MEVCDQEGVLFSHALNKSQPDNLDARLFIFVTGYLRFKHICDACDLVHLTISTLVLKPMIKKKITINLIESTHHSVL